MTFVETPLEPRRGDTPQAALRRLRHLLDVCVALNAVRDLDLLLGTIARTATTVLQCEAASILLYDDARQVLRFAAATGPGSAVLVGTEVPIEGSLAGTIFRENRPLLARNLDTDPDHFARAAEATGLRPDVLLGVPMRIDGERVGVLEVFNPEAETFDKADVETLLIISSQAAVALRNARMDEALVAAKARLEDLDRTRVQFMTIASHEMRTPLTAVLGFSDVLADEVPRDLQTYVAEVQRAAGRLQEIVETVEEMASLRDGTAELARMPMRVADLFMAVRQTVDRDVQVTLGRAGLMVCADGPRLRLALGHLLRNADAFTPPEGHVQLTAHPAGDAVTLRVTDTGRGIDADHLERVFEPFFQVEAADSRSHEGLGVGLAVARSVALKHGGRLWATSDGPGLGSTFHLRLPAAA